MGSSEHQEVQFVQYILEQITGGDDFSIDRRIDEKGVLIEVTLAKDHFGRVIGKGGETVEAIRRLLRAMGMKNDARYNLKLVEAE